MDIKAKIDEIVSKIKGDETLKDGFKKDPIKTVEGLIGVDLPDDKIAGIVDGVKAKLNLDGIGDKFHSLFGKKE